MKIYKWELFIIIILLSLFLFQSLITLRTTNQVFDEPAFITVGYYFVKFIDTSLFILHPPLSYILAGFPLLFLDIKMPYSYEECSDIGHYQCGQYFMFKSHNDPEKIGVYSRLPFIFISILLGLLLFFFSKELYGTRAGYFALTLYSFSPAILGFNTLVRTDLLVSFFIFGTIYLLWKLIMQGYTKTRLILVGISLGLALASKYTAIFLIPVIVLLFLIKAFQNKSNIKKSLKKFLIRCLIILVIGFIILNSIYFFSFDTIADSIPKRNIIFLDSLIDKNFVNGSLSYRLSIFLIHDLIIPIPEYWMGIAVQSYIGSAKMKQNYLNGEIYNGGKWNYFFEVLILKSPIPLIVFFIMSLTFFLKYTHKGFINEMFILLPIIVFFGIFLPSNLNLGLRHILPIMPFIFLFSSRILNIRFEKRTYSILFGIFIGVLLLWYILSAIFIMPHYMAYFNEFIGGPENGHKYLLSTNLDAGQDLKNLNRYLKNNNINNIKLSYHGSFDPSYFNISYEPLPMEYYIPWVPGFSSNEPSQNYKENCSKKYGIIAISISNLHNFHLINQSCFNWLKEFEPIKKIGYTIYVYNITY